MKKLLIASLCMTAFTLTACDKKTNDSTTVQPEAQAPATMTALSNNVVADIKSDLEQIETLSNTKAQEALSFQTEVTQAAQNSDKKALEAVVDKMEKYVDSFNHDLEALKLKSNEADALRDKMKDSNDLGLELAEAGVETKPDMNKVTELQKKAVELQQSILTDMQALQAKVKTGA